MLAYLKPHIHQFAGVTVMNGKHTVRILSDNRFFLVGTYDTSEEASLAYKRAVANERVRLSRKNADNKNPKDVTTPEGSTTPETATYAKVAPAAKAAARCKKIIRRSYIGVIERGNKFVAQIRTNNETKEFGTYDTPEEAAHAFDRVVIERKLPTSLLNYPACNTAKKEALTVSSSDKAVAALSALAIVTQQSKPKKKTKTANNENGRPELSAQGMRHLVQFYGGRIRCRDLVNAYSHKFTPLNVRINMGQSIITIDDNDENGKCFEQLVGKLLRLRKRNRVLYYELREQSKVDVTAKKRGPRTKNISGSTDDEKRLSFAEWYKECVTVGNQRSGQPIFKAKVVYQHYQQWCIQRNKPWMSTKGTLNFKAEMNKTGTPWYKHSDGSRYYHPIASIKGYDHIQFKVVQPPKAPVVTSNTPAFTQTGNCSIRSSGKIFDWPLAPKSKKKPKKKPKKIKAVPVFPFGIPEPLVKSFNDFFEETCRVDFTNSKPSDSDLLMVGDVHKEYRAWCIGNKRPYCPERTSKEWVRAPFVVNNRRADRLPPFRLLMFAKLDRLPRRVKDVSSSTETAWRRHKKSYVGHPYYQGLQWKDSFTPTLKYVHGKKR